MPTVAAILLCLLLFAGRGAAAAEVPAGDARGWSAAFSRLCDSLAREYPFSAWKGLDWPAIERELGPRVAAAEARGDRAAYYLALRELVWRLRDGHAHLRGDDGGAERAAVGGSFGLDVIRLDDGRLLASRVAPDGPAFRAGVRFGAEIVRWNGAAPDDALAAVPVLWSERPPATDEGRRQTQLRLLPRAPVGAQVALVYRNRRASGAPGPPGAAKSTGDAGRRRDPQAEITLTAEATTAPAGRSPCLRASDLLFSPAVESRTLAAGAGYVRLRFELPTLRTPFLRWTLRRALARFAAAGLPGVVVDVRGNCGGLDAMVPPLVAPFLRQAKLYEVPGIPAAAGTGFVPEPRRAVTVLPAPPLYRGRIAVLVDEDTLSAGEAIPLLLKGLPDVEVIGWSATQGSFGIGQRTLHMPGGLAVVFPHAQSLDGAGVVEVDGDAAGRGGVSPDRRLPLTEAVFDRRFGRGEDVALDEAVRFVRGEPAAGPDR